MVYFSIHSVVVIVIVDVCILIRVIALLYCHIGGSATDDWYMYNLSVVMTVFQNRHMLISSFTGHLHPMHALASKICWYRVVRGKSTL